MLAAIAVLALLALFVLEPGGIGQAALPESADRGGPTTTSPPSRVASEDINPAQGDDTVVGGFEPVVEDQLDASCFTGAEHAPSGILTVVAGSSSPSSELPLKTYIVELEEGLAIDAECFAARVDEVLGDPRSWGELEGIAMQRVDEGEPDFRVTLASPATTDKRCEPLNTNGIYSCWDAERAMINVWRWQTGTEDYSDNLREYQTYVINHEVGHGLGHSHVECTGRGDVAPVMMQQTKGLDGCAQNGWPAPVES